MTAALDLSIKLADDLEQFPLEKCGPSDDPDMQYAYTAGFLDIARRFVGAIRRIGDPDLSEMVSSLNLDISDLVAESHDLRRKLFVVIDALKEASANPEYGKNVASNAAFLNPDLLMRLKALPAERFDVMKLVRMCEELNDAYARGNYISACLLVRAVMNHVPPVFGRTTFKEVISQSGRSVKAILSRLENDARPIADLHTHMMIRKVEQLPTKNQIEPYKSAFEVLISEVTTKIADTTAA